MKKIKPKIIDLFSGVGGFSLGATRTGFQLVLAVDIDEHAMASHKINFPSSNHLTADITDLDSVSIMQNAGIDYDELDGLIGGPPCQGFSMIGKRNTLDPRNDLFIKFFELVSGCQPKFFIAENVLGILSDRYKEILEKAFAYVNDDFILLDPMILKASDFGAPTTRERVFIIGYRPDFVKTLKCEDFFANKITNPVTVADALLGLPDTITNYCANNENNWRTVQKLPRSEFWDRVSEKIPDNVGDDYTIKLLQNEKLVSGCLGTRHSDKVIERFSRLKPGERDIISKAVRLRMDGFCPTIRAGTNKDHGSFQAVRPIHPNCPRVITPREAARLQGFPDWFRFSPTKWHSFRQIGNSVSPILAEKLFNIIREKLKN